MESTDPKPPKFCHHLLNGLGNLTLNHVNTGSNPVGDTKEKENCMMIKFEITSRNPGYKISFSFENYSKKRMKEYVFYITAKPKFYSSTSFYDVEENKWIMV